MVNTLKISGGVLELVWIACVNGGTFFKDSRDVGEIVRC